MVERNSELARFNCGVCEWQDIDDNEPMLEALLAGKMKARLEEAGVGARQLARFEREKLGMNHLMAGLKHR